MTGMVEEEEALGDKEQDSDLALLLTGSEMNGQVISSGDSHSPPVIQRELKTTR